MTGIMNQVACRFMLKESSCSEQVDLLGAASTIRRTKI
jgi:hypothetical protein